MGDWARGYGKIVPQNFDNSFEDPNSLSASKKFETKYQDNISKAKETLYKTIIKLRR